MKFRKWIVWIIDYQEQIRLVLSGLMLIAVYLVFFKSFFQPLLLEKIYKYLEVPSAGLNDLIFLFVFLTLPIYVYVTFKNVKQTSFKKSNYLLIFFYLVIYVFARMGFPRSLFIFTPFKQISWLAYADVLVIYAIWMIYKAPKAAPKKDTKSKFADVLIEDDLYNLKMAEDKPNQDSKTGGNDIFRRRAYAGFIAGMISGKETKKSFAIAVKGSWGSGKTVFLQQVKDQVTQCVTMNFNPWASGDYKEVSVHFFNSMIALVEPYDRTLSRSLRTYHTALLDIDKEVNKGMLKSIGLIKEKEAANDINTLKENIASKLSAINMKIIVFIDDLDRANAEEVLSVFKIIRNSFEFPNIFFLVAYDDSYIKEILTESTDSPSRYLEKIFQFEIDLPAFPHNLLSGYFLKVLKEFSASSREEIVAAYQYLERERIIGYMITGMRDISRFMNSFNHSYLRKATEVDLIDFFIIELLKLKQNEIYKDIRRYLTGMGNTPYLHITKTANEKDEPAVELIKENFKMFDNTPPDNKFYTSLLQKLFTRTDNFDIERSVRFRSNSIRYFSDDLFGGISFTAFDIFKDPEFDPPKKFIDEVFERAGSDNDQLDRLIGLMERAGEIPSDSRAYNIFRGFIYIGNKTGYYRYYAERATTVCRKSLFNFAPKSTDDLVNDKLQFYFSWQEGPMQNSSMITESIALSILMTTVEADPKDYSHPVKIAKDILQNNLQKNLTVNTQVYTNDVFYIYEAILDNRRLFETAEFEMVSYPIRNYMEINNEIILKSLILPDSSVRPSLWYISNPLFNSRAGEEMAIWYLLKMDYNYPREMWFYFYLLYRHNDYKPIAFNFKVVDVVSDRYTYFISSPTYSQLASNVPAIEITGKQNISSTHPELEGASWITHVEPVTLKEAQQGGVYQFRREINLSGQYKKLKSAFIHLLVDDYITINVNGTPVNERFEGVDKLHGSDITFLLASGKFNNITFNIENRSFSADQLKGRPENNPYMLIYKIVIEFEEDLFLPAELNASN